MNRIVLVAVLAGCRGTQPAPPAPQPAATPSAPTARERMMTERHEASIAIEDAMRRRGAAWKIETGGVESEVLIVRNMWIGVDGANGSDLCTRQEFPSVVNDGLKQKASAAELETWRTPFRKFARVECDTEGRTVISLMFDEKKSAWSIDGTVPDLGASFQRAAAPQPRRRPPREVVSDDPDRFMIGQ